MTSAYSIANLGNNYTISGPQKLSIVEDGKTVAWCDGRSLFLDWSGIESLATTAKGGNCWSDMGAFVAAMLIAARDGKSGEAPLPEAS